MILSTPYRGRMAGLGSPNCSDVSIPCGTIGPVDCVGLQSDVKTNCGPTFSTTVTGIAPPLQGEPCNLGGYVSGLTHSFDSTMGILPVLQYFPNFACDPMYVAGVMTPAVLGVVLVLGLLGGRSSGGGRRRR